MGKERKVIVRKKVLIRDSYSCQKCKVEDNTGRTLEIHHIIPVVYGGTDELDNLLTLCRVCHKYAPNNKEKFIEYMDSEMDGIVTTLLLIYKNLKESGKIE